MQQQLPQEEPLEAVLEAEEVLVGVALQVLIHQVHEEEENGKSSKKYNQRSN
jgi:hypothetical protein